MAKPEFKYKINVQLSRLPRTMTIGQIEQILKKDHNISRDTFYRDRNVTIHGKHSIPSDRLDIYAALFNCSADDLKNYKIDKIKPLTERKPSDIMKKIMKHTGLKK